MLAALAKARYLYTFSKVYERSGKLRPTLCYDHLNIQKTFTTSSAVLVRKINNHRKISRFDEDDYYVDRQDPENFGKIIGLNPDEVEIDDEKPSKVVIKKSKLKKKFHVDLSGNKVKLKETSFHEDDSIVKSEKTNQLKQNDVKKQEINYEKLGNRNVILSSKIPVLKSKKLRNRTQRILLEGKRLIHDALAAGCTPISIFFSRNEDVMKLKIPDNVKLYKAPYSKIQLWSDVTTSQGVIGIFKMPDLSMQNNDQRTIPLIVICDNIREPGNLGAVLRVVTSVGCEKIILTKGCVDIWEPKVLRAGAGTHFRLPILKNMNWTEIDEEIGKEDRVIVADNSMPPEDDDSIEGDDGNYKKSESFKTGNANVCSHLPPVYYTSLNYTEKSTVLVIGGETSGLSVDAYEFAKARHGVRVCIPMCNKVESLNIAVALGILTYEVRRQWEFPLKNDVHIRTQSEENVKEEVERSANF